MSTLDINGVLKDFSTLTIKTTLSEMRNSGLSMCIWDILFESAPVVLRCMGACLMAAASQDLAAIQVPKLPNASIERPEDLVGNLIQFSHLGTSTIAETDTRFRDMNQDMSMVQEKAQAVFKALKPPREAAQQLPLALQDLQSIASKCFQSSQSIEADFKDWLQFASELWEACESLTRASADITAQKIHGKAIEAINVVDPQAQIELIKKSVEEVQNAMDATTAAFEKAAKALPSGWDIAGQQIVQGLSDCVMTAISGAMLKINSPTQYLVDAWRLQSAFDPVLPFVQKDLVWFHQLNSMLRNVNGGPDWDAVESGLAFIQEMMQLAKDDLSKFSGPSRVKTTHAKALEDTLKITEEILKAAKDGKRLQKDSESFTHWQTTYSSVYETIIGLSLLAQSRPFNSPSPSTAIPDEKHRATTANAAGSVSQATLTHAAARLHNSTRVLDCTLSNYGDRSKVLSGQMAGFSCLNSTLDGLATETIQLEEVKVILVQCMRLIIGMKNKITELTLFFRSISAIIKTLTDNLVKQWLETLQRSEILKIGAYTHESAQRSMITQGCISIVANFSLVADVARFWKDVSDTSIVPGLALVESLSFLSNTEPKMQNLSYWSMRSYLGIRKQLGAERAGFREKMMDRLEVVRDMASKLPASAIPAEISDIAQKSLWKVGATYQARIMAQYDDNPLFI